MGSPQGNTGGPVAGVSLADLAWAAFRKEAVEVTVPTTFPPSSLVYQGALALFRTIYANSTLDFNDVIIAKGGDRVPVVTGDRIPLYIFKVSEPSLRILDARPLSLAPVLGGYHYPPPRSAAVWIYFRRSPNYRVFIDNKYKDRIIEEQQIEFKEIFEACDFHERNEASTVNTARFVKKTGR